ncbi:Uma2 family endonuclease [Streptomyces odonnellii]|uniref:Uma2 family endonuclease n=1 Tax=Streptomyces odonnellii TaxID=1417980 RepID=UPI000626DA70|nr:Uma2 family endonuclease [Streptomyces odonnellii]
MTPSASPSFNSSPGIEVRPQMSIEDFEELARKAPETVRLEFINGKLEVKPVPDGDHGAIVMWLLERCLQQRSDLRLYPEQGLLIDAYRAGRARPDGALTPRNHFVGQGEWASPDGVLMTVEVTSHDYDTNRRDRIDKRDGYAAAGIPVYLLIDRDAQELLVYSEPRGGGYESRALYAYGSAVKLPDPVGITLETEELKDYTH